MKKRNSKRVGVFRGTFDPIHEGHIAFANQAILSTKLDCVYFLPENSPKHKNKVDDFSKRLKTVAQAIGSHSSLRVLKLHNMNGSIKDVMPELKKLFGDADLVFLMGSDVAKTIHHWADAKSLCKDNELFIGMRQGDSTDEIKNMLNALVIKPAKVTVIDAPNPSITSSAIRRRI